MQPKAEKFEQTLAYYTRVMLTISVVITASFGAYHFWGGEPKLAVVEGVITVLFGIGLWLLRKQHRVYMVMHGVMLVGIVAALLNMREDNNTAMWLGAMLIAAFALFGRKKGLFWIALINFSIWCFMLVDALAETPVYSPYFATNVVLSSLWMSLIAYFAYQNTDEIHALMREEQALKAQRKTAQTLAAGMAHVMNNEMLALVGKLECLQFRLKDKKDIAEIEAAISLAMQVSEHGNRLALYAQADPDKKQKVDVYATLLVVLKQWEKQLGGQPDGQIEVHVQAPDAVAVCMVNEVQIAQALLQVLENAKDAIHQRWHQQQRVSPGHITISFAQVEVDKQSYLRIAIADDGCGIAKSMRAHMFEPYVSSKSAGKGMGLAVVKSIMEQHQGMVSVESDEGKGSLFYLWLPLAAS